MGFSDTIKSAAYLNSKGWQPLPDMPVELKAPCVVGININSTITFLIIGGLNYHGLSLKESYTFSFDKKEWVQHKALLKTRRGLATCGRIFTNSSGKEYTTIVVGGYLVGVVGGLKTTEVLDDSANHWRPGPELPVGTASAVMVQDWEGGVILVGGSFSEITYEDSYDTLWRLSDVGPNAAWIKMKQKLKTPRYGHVAFFIPDSLTSCTIVGNRSYSNK